MTSVRIGGAGFLKQPQRLRVTTASARKEGVRKRRNKRQFREESRRNDAGGVLRRNDSRGAVPHGWTVFGTKGNNCLPRSERHRCIVVKGGSLDCLVLAHNPMAQIQLPSFKPSLRGVQLFIQVAYTLGPFYSHPVVRSNARVLDLRPEHEKVQKQNCPHSEARPLGQRGVTRP